MKTKWKLIETGDKLFLFTEYTVEDYEATKGYTTSRPVPGRPLSKKDCLKLARILLNQAAR